MDKKLVPINYTSRDFNSIKRDLVEHAKRFYPDSFKDFNEASFGSLMLDTVAYVGDVLSFYLDYQANESFLETASEFNNLIKLGKQVGYKHENFATSAGIVTFYIGVPSSLTSNSPDYRYVPVLKKGSTLTTKNAVKFILTEDVRFDNPLNETRVLKVGPTGAPQSYAIKAKGSVVSGLVTSENVIVGPYEKFKKIALSKQNIIEILSVTDTEGNEYYEVENLLQNIIYKSFTNKNLNDSRLAKEILKPFLVPRRFIVDRDINTTYLQFGASSNITVSSDNMIADPSTVALQLHGKDYISSDYFDPTRLLSSDKYGIAPSNTTLIVTYRYQNIAAGVNFASNSIAKVETGIFEFKDEQSLNKDIMLSIKNSIECTNDNPIVGEVSTVNSDELKRRIQGSYAAQSRAVTLKDYKALCYSMPMKFGSVKRVNVLRDENSLKRNLNLYVLCEDQDGYLAQPNMSVKNNLKTWLNKNKMINDSIDILNGKIVNFGIEFVAIGSKDRQKFDILTDATNQLIKDFFIVYDFGEPLTISDVYTSLKKVTGLIDVISVRIVPKVGGVYSDASFSFDQNSSPDGRYINVPLNVVMELKYPKSDIKGTII